MVLKVSVALVLRDALAYPGPEPFEQAIGRSVRRHGGAYEDYVDLVTRLREAARDWNVSLREAARRMSDQP